MQTLCSRCDRLTDANIDCFTVVLGYLCKDCNKQLKALFNSY